MKRNDAVWQCCALFCIVFCLGQALFMSEVRAEGLAALRLTRQVESLLSQAVPPPQECRLLANQCMELSVLYARKSNPKSGFDQAIHWRLQALALQEKMRPQNPQDTAAAYHEISRLYVNAQNFKKAAEYGIKAVKIEEKICPQNERVALINMYEAIAFHCEAARRYDQAIRWRKKAINMAEALQYEGIEVDSIYNNMILLYEMLKEYDQAISWQYITIDRHRKNGSPRLNYAYEQMARLCWDSGKGDVEVAKKWLLLAVDNAKQKNPPNDWEISNAYIKLSILYTELGDLTQASTWQAAAREADRRAKDRGLSLLVARYSPEDQALNLKKIQICEIYGCHEEAISYINQEISRNPNDDKWYAWRGQIYLELGNERLASQDFAKAATLTQNHKELYQNIAAEYLKRNKGRQAVAYYTKVIELEKDKVDWQGYYNRAAAYVAMGEYQKALDDLDSAIALEPDRVYQYIKKGNIYVKLEEWEQALQWYNKISQGPGEFSEGYICEVLIQRAQVHHKMGNIKAWLADLDQVIDQEGNFRGARKLKATMLLLSGDWNKSIALYDEAIRLQPSNAIFYLGRGYARYKYGDQELGADDYRRAFYLEPDVLRKCIDDPLDRKKFGEIMPKLDL